MRLRFTRPATRSDPVPEGHPPVPVDHGPDPTRRGDGSEDTSAGAPMPATPDAGRAGHALRAPSKLHAFNRYEIKYLVETSRIAALREALAARLATGTSNIPATC